MRQRALLSSLVLSAAALSLGPAQASDGYYQGKTVTMYFGSTVGGAHHGYATLIGRHLGKHLPGNPNVVVKSMPGGGSRTLMNYLTFKAAKDGTEFGHIDRSLLLDPLLFPERNTTVDPKRLNWIGSPSAESMLCVTWHKSRVQTIADLKSNKFIIPSLGTDSSDIISANLMNMLLGASVHVVRGYPGGVEMNLAMERGEVDGRCAWGWNSIKSTRTDWIERKEMKLLLQFATSSHPDLKHVPVIGEIVSNQDDRDLLALMFANQKSGRPYAAPAGVPPAQVAMLREGFARSLADPALLDEAKRLKLDIDLVSGQDIDDIVKVIFGSRPDVVERAKKLSQ
jgi:tripartite-type tricarboxylate transporter receptor subunit TctC